MIVDSSALLSIVLKEFDAEFFHDQLRHQFPVYIGAPTLVEASIAAVRRSNPEGTAKVRRIIQAYNIRIVDFTLYHVGLANIAFETFGKGNHKAGLNFGDCLSYALAAGYERPLLCKGNDFVLTDLPIISPPA